MEALTRGKQPMFFLIDGSDLVAVLQDQIELPALLRLSGVWPRKGEFSCRRVT